MSRRIIKDTYENGTHKYRVETNDGVFSWLWKILNVWFDDEYYIDDNVFLAEFNTLAEAKEFCNDTMELEVINSEIIEVIN